MSHGTVLPASEILPISDVLPDVDPAAIVALAFLAGYTSAETREAYRRDLQLFFDWCQAHQLHPLNDVKRAHLQAYASHLTTARGNSAATVRRRIGTLAGYYATAVIDKMLEHSPATHLKLPTIHEDPAKRTWLTRWELGAVLRVAEESSKPADWALVTLLGTLGMRVSAACAVRIEDLSTDGTGYRYVHTIGKGGKPSMKVLPIPTWRAIDRAAGDRKAGPLLLRRDGSQMVRKSATRVVERLCATAGVKKHITPHSLRRSFATIALAAGVPIEVVQADMDHASSRVTQRYNRLGVEPHARASNTVAAALAAAG